MLYGSLPEIRRRFSSQEVIINPLSELPAEIPGVVSVHAENSETHLQLAEGVSPQDILESLVRMQIPLERFEVAVPTLDQIFIQVVKGQASE